MEHRQAEFNELENTGWGYMKEPADIPGAPDLKGWYQQIRLWHFPALYSQRVWAVFQRKRPSDCGVTNTLLRQVTWDRIADTGRLSDPLQGLAKGFHVSPTMEIRDRPVDTDAYEARLAVLRKITFPAFAKSPIGLDGESFGIELEHRNTLVDWWCDGPDSWQELTQWAAATREWLESIASAEFPV